MEQELYLIGQKFFKIPKQTEERINDVFRTINYFDNRIKVIHTHNYNMPYTKIELFNTANFDLNYKIAPHHFIIKIQHALLKNGLEDFIITIFNKDCYIPIYYTTLLRAVNEMFPIYISADMTEKYEDYEKMIKDLSLDVAKINKEFEIAGYFGDTLKNILSLFEQNNYIISAMSNLIKNNSNKEFYGTDLQVVEEILNNICKFSECYRKLFGIYKFPFSLTGKKELNAGDKFLIEAAIQDNLIDYILIQYYIDIELDKIKNKYLLMEDNDNKLFILNYHSMKELPGLY